MQLDQPGVIFRYSFLALVCLSTTIITYSENILFPQILGIPIILLSFRYVDNLKVISVNSTTAAFFGLIAISVGFAEFLIGGIEARILSAAHVVSYLLWVTLLQKKDPRQYWWMTALTVMQVAVASVLTSDGLFGLGMLLYLFLIIWTLAFFSVYRAALRIRSATNQVHAKLQKAATSVASERKLSLKSSRSTARGSIHLNPGEPWISWQFFGGVTTITFLSLIVAGMFFLFTPRLWLGKLHFPSDTEETTSATSISGFTESVRLGEMGSILENPATVFNVQIVNQNTDAVLSIEEFCADYGMEALLFRGSVMTGYKDSKWKVSSEALSGHRLVNNRRQETYACDYEQEQTTGSFLFSLGRIGDIEEMSESIGVITFDAMSEVIKTSYPGKLKYRHTIYPSIQKNGHLCSPVTPDMVFNYFTKNYLKTCSSFPALRLESILNFTKTLISQEEKRLGRAMTVPEIAFYLESFLQTSSEFKYSLNQTINDPSIDPVEDFLINRKSGHCEYFSSALALMLRSQGIPTRLISGFKGGNFDSDKKRIEVKQLHAHAWLEFFDAEGMQWITLDPTPGVARENQLAQIQSNFNIGESISSKALNFWNNYVVNVNLEQQQRMLYAPLYSIVHGTWNSLEGVRNFVGTKWEIVVEIFSDPKQLFSLKGFMLVSFLGTIAVVLWFLFNWVIPSIKRQMISKNLRYRTDLKILFYERYVQVLKKLRLVREDQQTPLELSLAAGKVLENQAVLAEYLPLLEEITQAYYHIRFGQYEISDREQQQWINKITHLDELIVQTQALKK